MLFVSTLGREMRWWIPWMAELCERMVVEGVHLPHMSFVAAARAGLIL